MLYLATTAICNMQYYILRTTQEDWMREKALILHHTFKTELLSYVGVTPEDSVVWINKCAVSIWIVAILINELQNAKRIKDIYLYERSCYDGRIISFRNLVLVALRCNAVCTAQTSIHSICIVLLFTLYGTLCVCCWIGCWLFQRIFLCCVGTSYLPGES